MRTDRERLQDVLDSIAHIQRYAAFGRAAFDASELYQVWMIHHIGVIGEACRAMSDALKQRHPAVPWPEIIFMRNRLVHAYFGIRLDLVWDTVEQDIPALKPLIEDVLRQTP
jgi:uncharacterized protein with HEPN domain